MTLWLPENEDHDDFLFARTIKGDPRITEFRARLNDLDPQLDLVYAKPGATFVAKDDRWYIIRRTDTGIGGMWVCEDENGEFTFPNEAHLNALRALDVQRHGDVALRLAIEREKKEQAEQREKDLRSEAFRSELGERISSVYDSTISVPKAVTDDAS